MTDEMTPTFASDETIEEAGQTAETPATEPIEPADDVSDIAFVEDKAEAEPADDPTSELQQVAQENFLGTFKTKEDADKGFKEAQSKITAQGNRIKELEAALRNNPHHNELSRRTEEFSKKLNADYKLRMDLTKRKYDEAFNKLVAQVANPHELKNIHLQYYSRLYSELGELNAAFNSKLTQGLTHIQQEVQQAETARRARDLERFSNGKTGEMIVSAWYDEIKSIDDVAEIFSKYKALVIEDYLKEQAEKGEDTSHKGKLATNADSSSKPKYGNNHIFTLKELAAMSDEEFAKYESIIDAQVAKRLVK